MLSFFKNILSCLTFSPLFQHPCKSKPLEFQDGMAQDFEVVSKDINHAFNQYHQENKHLLSPENKEKVDNYLSNL